MRVDHHAYQRATRAASVGFLAQAGFGLTLLIFGLLAGDTLFVMGSAYVLIGVLAWLSLIVIFNQHKQERLEALEHDELSAERGGAGSAFDEAEDEVRVQARRLRIMHKWMMPIVSLAVAIALGVVAWIIILFNGWVEEGERSIAMTERLGWAVSICLALSAVSFIVSRFVAGMAKQPAWQNLRGGAAFMVGNALVMLSIAVAIGFRFFDKSFMVDAIAWAIPIFMIVVAAEVVLNFILNLYRPRVAGETPRPAFDSRILSLLSAPDNLVRSINEAVNYQFGFDVTSSWGYQLFLRSFIWLLALGIGVMILLNTMVIVEPNQQAVKLRFGEIVENKVHGSGVLWKLPWPFETAELYDVTTIRELSLTPRRRESAANVPAYLWTDADLSEQFTVVPDPFLVRPYSLETVSEDEARLLAERAADTEGADSAIESVLAEDAEDEQVAQQFSLVHTELVMQYHVKPENDGLLQFLDFSSEWVSRRDRTTVRGEALKGVALRAITQHLAGQSLDQLLGAGRGDVSDELRDVVQRALDEREAGVRVASIDVLMLRPAGEVAPHFEELSRSRQSRRLAVYEAERNVATTFTSWLGDVDRTEDIIANIDRYNAMRADPEADPEEMAALEATIERELVEARGLGARMIAEAERDRLVRIIGARQTASRLRGQIIGYRAAPELYKQREIMQVMKETLGRLPKYVLGVDPSRIRFDLNLEELNPLFNPYDTVEDETQGEGG